MRMRSWRPLWAREAASAEGRATGAALLASLPRASLPGHYLFVASRCAQITVFWRRTFVFGSLLSANAGSTRLASPAQPAWEALPPSGIREDRQGPRTDRTEGAPPGQIEAAADDVGRPNRTRRTISEPPMRDPQTSHCLETAARRSGRYLSPPAQVPAYFADKIPIDQRAELKQQHPGPFAGSTSNRPGLASPLGRGCL